MKYLGLTARFLVFSFLTIATGCKDKVSVSDPLSKNPNVILIVTDDQGYGDLGYHGNPYTKTPHLDRFASESLELTNFHVGTTCAPTRAGVMTGRNANRNNAWHTIAGCSILLETEETIAEVFTDNGYDTAMFGKWHLGDNYPFRPQDRGFAHAIYHGGGGVGQTPDYWNNDYFDDTYFRNGVPQKFEGYCTDVWFNEAMDFLREHDAKSPFFLYLAPNAAHGPFNVPEKYAKMYEEANLTEKQKRFYGMVSNIDDNFGKLVTYLKEEKLFDNTILIFTTDNGTALGISRTSDDKILGFNAGLRGIKGSNYDGGHKVPFFMGWPNGNILKGTTSNELVSHVDLLPTLTDLANIPYTPKNPLDGTSMAKILSGEEQSKDRMLVVDTQRNQWPLKGRYPCVMSTEWRLVNGVELYNILDDPGQQTDVAEQYPNVVSKMQAFYDVWWSTVEPDIKYAEIPLGNSDANPVLMTIHDMHTTDGLPWNQVQIRKGELSPNGFYNVKVVDDGDYQFQLYRYPSESDLSLNAAAKEIPGTPYRDGLPEGKKIYPSKAIVELGDLVLTADVDEDSPFVIVKGKLKKGSYKLKSNFTDAQGVMIPSYYTQIEKL
ncbi:arylsulfatase [Ulvibacterium sp.]|uniref:arylsulfatase n=1 Tax=Ulvibacterium sp. TaxID=2665914 RepID=UPI00261DB5B9|nr:arylsulfatase [Ulvibacterium sp.]